MAEQWTTEHAGQLQPEPAATPAQSAEQAAVLEVVQNFAFGKSYEDAQRRAEEEENEFEAVDMWGEDARKNREEQDDPVTGRKIPAKPTLTVNLLDQHIQQVLNEARQARLSLTVKPRTGMANTKTANYFKGLIRIIQADSGALAVRLWALERTARVGRGAYAIRADYADDGDFDLDLMLDRILDQSTVYWDPYAQHADWSDAEWCILTDWVSEDERVRRWRDKPLLVPEHGFESETDDWFAVDAANKQQRRVRIATYYKVIHRERVLAYHPQTGTKPLEEMPPAIQEAVKAQRPGTRTRKVDHREIVILTVDGTQVLQTDRWLGRYIPIVGTIGKEYLVRGGKRRFKGVIANTMDISRAINVLISSATEIAGQMPRVPYIMFAGQDENFEEEWDDAPVKNYTRLHVNAVDVDGKPAPLPQRQNVELPIQGLMFLLRMLMDLFHAVTGSVAPQLRAVNPYDRSGKAIDLLQRQGAAGTSSLLDNLATIAMPYEGRVFVDAIPKYYDKPGRVLRIAADDKDEETAIMLKVPFVHDADGNPVPVPCPKCQGQKTVPGSLWNPFVGSMTCPVCHGTGWATKDNMPPDVDGQPVEYVDFAEGQYKVLAVIDRSYQTKQDEALAGMAQLAQAAPNLVPAYAAAWVRAMGFAGSQDVAENIEAAFPIPNKDLAKQKIPPAFAAEYQQLKQQHEMAMQALGEAQKLLETDAIKQAGQKEITVIKAAMAEKLEQIKAEGRLIEAQQDAQASVEIEAVRGQITSMQQEAEQRHEIVMQLLKELGAKEQERHSVALHDAAAASAAARANLDADLDVRRQDVLADRQAQRDEDAAARQAGRDDDAATKQTLREDVSAERQASRDETAAEREARRAREAADREAAREDQRARETREPE